MKPVITRRTFLRTTTACALSAMMPGQLAAASSAVPATRTIASSGEQIPCVGLGSWITFNVGNDPVLLADCVKVIQAFAAGGGRMIDSSPMYGSSQNTIGHAIDTLGIRGNIFAADKVWSGADGAGRRQIKATQLAWRVRRFELLQVHNLYAWQAHLETLFGMKERGELKYVGITTSHGRRHDDMEQIMRDHPIDFVQLTYNVRDREAENRLLPLARERGIAVIVNRPYRRGGLIRSMQRHPLPDWAEAEAGSTSWAQLLLKFTLAHPAVTCAIPATTRVDHVQENLKAGADAPLDARVRKRLHDYVQSL